MSAFTGEQQQVLEAMARVTVTYVAALHTQLTDLQVEVFTLKGLLLRKSVMSEDEVAEAIRQVKVGLDLERQFNPHQKALEDELRRVLEEGIRGKDDEA